MRIALSGLFALAMAGGLSACAAPGAAAPDATLRVLAGEATVDGVDVDGPEKIAAGDVVEVTGSGAITEIQWADGSFTRLADDSRFEVGGAGVRGTLDRGTAWNTVGPASAGYAIATDEGAVRADPDTTFAVRCDDACDGVAITGALTLDDETAVTAPASFTLDGAEVEPVGWDSVYADPFALANSLRDEQAGFSPASDAWAGRDPALASLSGFFDGAGEVVDQTCTGWPEECARVESTIFAYTGSNGFTVAADCGGTLPCTVGYPYTVTLSTGATEARTAELVFDGESYSFSVDLSEGAYCFFDDGRQEGRYANTYAGRLVPARADVRDGVFVVTELRVEETSMLARVEGTTDPTCSEFEYEWVNSTASTVSLVESAAAAVDPLPVDASPLRPVAGPARPSVLSGLRTPLDAIPTLEQASLLAAGILVLVLVLGYPAYLLSRVVSDRYDDAVGKRAARVRERVEARPAARRSLLVLGLIVAALITAAIDPAFGAQFVPVLADPGSIGSALGAFATDVASWRLVLTALAAFILFLGFGSLVVRLAARRIAPGIAMPMAFRWGSLLILAAGVVVSRVFDINPGIVFGLVAGLVISDSIPLAGRGRLALVSAIFSLVAGFGAWIGFGVLSPVAAESPHDVGLVFAVELLSALTVEAISTLPLALLPIVGLEGGTLRGWRVIAWLVTYAAGFALFVLLLFTLPGSWTEIPRDDAVRWLIGFAVFSAVAVLVWGVHEGLRRRKAKREAKVAVAATVDPHVEGQSS